MYGNREAIITSGVDDKPKPGDTLTNVPNRPPKAAPRTLSPVPPVVAPRYEIGPPPVAPRNDTGPPPVAPRNDTGPPPVVPRNETSVCVRVRVCVCTVCSQCIANSFALS